MDPVWVSVQRNSLGSFGYPYKSISALMQSCLWGLSLLFFKALPLPKQAAAHESILMDLCKLMHFQPGKLFTLMHRKIYVNFIRCSEWKPTELSFWIIHWNPLGSAESAVILPSCSLGSSTVAAPLMSLFFLFLNLSLRIWSRVELQGKKKVCAAVVFISI